MAKVTETYLHPVSQRTLQSIRLDLSRGTAAFYIGAGVDRQLAEDAKSESLTWSALLARLRPFPKATEREMENYARDWPTETALAARLRLGEEKFKETISTFTDSGFLPNLKAPFTRLLSKALLKTNLIVTPNYSSHVVKTLEAASALNKFKPEIIVLTREDLASFQFPIAESNPSRIFVIHIHGRCVERSNLIFDAWGYNIAVNDDPYYHAFLFNLFSYRSVIGIGTSWSDIPIRNQAALVFRTQNYQRPNHVSFDYCQDKNAFKKNAKANSARREWANAMQAAYGVRMISVNQERQDILLEDLSSSDVDLKGKPDINDIPGIAVFLDNCGDYESPIQQQWLLEMSPSRSLSAASRIQATVEKLYGILIKRIKRSHSSWEQVARIERHLRHFHYLYVAPFKPTNSDQIQLWDELAKVVTTRIWSKTEPNLRLNFLVGEYELARAGPSKLRKFPTGDSLYDRRLKLSKSLWAKTSPELRIDNALRVLDLGWESMSSKLFLNAATQSARTAPRDYDPKISRSILRLTSRGSEVARATGYFRREAKAETLAAMWLPDAQESRIRILSKLRAAEFYPINQRKGSTLSNSALIEPALMAGLTAGLLASHIRTLDLFAASEADLDRQLHSSFTPLLAEAGLRWEEVPKSLMRYWEELIERRLQYQFSKAIKGEYFH